MLAFRQMTTGLAAVLMSVTVAAAQTPPPPPPVQQPPPAQQPPPTPSPAQEVTYKETLVVSASKTEQQLVDAPATMTVIGPRTLSVAPSTNYADLLRNVPGVNVTQISARDVNITSRSATSSLATSQLAVVDGRSIYQDFFGFTMWDFMPNDLDEIKRVEVIRGPASAVWGANALTGVVNVITKSPRENPGTTVTLAGWALFGLGLSGAVPQIFSAAGNIDAGAPGRNMSRVVGMGYIGFLAGPATIGWLSEATSLTVAMTVPLACVLAAAALAGSVGERSRRTLERVDESVG